MSRKQYLFIFLSFLLSSSSAFGQIWQKHSKSGNSNLIDVVFVSKSKGYALGFNKVFATADTGKTWNQILNSYSGFNRIMFSDESNGLIIGNNDLVLKTNDRGDNWSLIRTGNSDDDLLALYPKSKDTLFVLGPDDISTNKFGNYLEYTYDGGKSWKRLSTGSTNTIRSLYMWDKNRGIMGSLTAGAFITNNGFTSYNVNWNANNILDTRVIKDSVVIIVGLNGRINRSNDYGTNWKTINSGTNEDLYGLHFANDSIGMACGDNGIILFTEDGGLNWSKMPTQTSMPFRKVYVINQYYAWAVAQNGSGDSLDIFKFGSEKYVLENINHVKGQVAADIIYNCQLDANEIGPAGVLIKAVPGPYYAYTKNKGQYEMVIPDTGKFTITADLPNKYGGNKNLCDTAGSKSIRFKTFENVIGGNNFFFKADSTVRLEVNISSARKRRCALNNNTISYKNIGFKTVDSTIIRMQYSPYTSIVKADKPYTIGNGEVIFKTGPLLPGEGGVIQVIDSVFCNNPDIRGLSACMKVLITPLLFVEKTNWDSSWVKIKVDCFKDSLAIVKIYNEGDKDMSDSTAIDLYLNQTLVDSKRYLIPSKDSLKYALDPAGKAVFVETVLQKQHPYLPHIRVVTEGCGDSMGLVTKQMASKYALQEFPSFEDEVCLVIRDAYDPNDIAVLPEGLGSKHYIKNDQRLRYTIRFQNTGTDTAYNITILDTLPNEINLAELEMLKGSHDYKYSLINDSFKTILKIDFNNIYLADSFVNEPLSHGYVVFDVRLKDALKKGTRIENTAEIYFDYNPAVVTNTVFNTIYDTVFTNLKYGTASPCMSRFVKTPNDTVVCDKFDYETAFIIEGTGTPTWKFNDFLASLTRPNDTIAEIKTIHDGRFELYMELNSCDDVWYDTAVIFYWKNPTIRVKDSLYCGAVNDNIYFNCFACAYLWNDSLSTYNFKPDKPGTYWVKVTNRCKSIADTFTLSYLPFVSIDLGRDTFICENQSLALGSSLTQGKFLWNDLDTNAFKSVNKAGTYSLTFENICNLVSDTITISEKRTPKIDLGKDSVYCFSVDQAFDLDSIKNEFDILWNDGNTASQRQFMDSGTYWVELKNSCGMAMDSIILSILNIPSIDLGKDSIYCWPFSREVTIDPKVDTYNTLWWDGNNNLKRIFDTTGMYTARVFNRCGSNSDTLNLGILKVPEINLGKDTTYCQSFQHTINLDPKVNEYSIQWWDGDNSISRVLDTEGKFYARISNRCGMVEDTIYLQRANLPQIQLGRDTIYCQNFTRLLNAYSNGAKYLWNTGDTSASISVDSAGQYWVKLDHYCGTVTQSISLTQIDPPILDLGKDTIVEGTVNLNLNAGNIGSQFLWNSGETSQVLNVTKHGLYWVEVSNYCGKVRDSIDIMPASDLSPFSKLQLWPNPVKGSILNIRYVTGSFELEIFNTEGKLLQEGFYEAGEHNIDLGDYSQGLYLLRVKNLIGQTKVFKFIKI